MISLGPCLRKIFSHERKSMMKQFAKAMTSNNKHDQQGTQTGPVVAWKATGIRNKIFELKIFIQSLSTEVVLLSETLLNPNDLFKIENYLWYRTDRLTVEEGVI